MSRNMTYGFNENKEKISVWNEEYVNNVFQRIIYKDDMAVIYGRFNTPEANSQELGGSATINYPFGFNAHNSCVLSIMGKNATLNSSASDSNNINIWATPIKASSVGYVLGSGDLRVLMHENNMNVFYTKSDTHEPSTIVNFRLVLMKLPVINVTGMYKGDVNEDGVVDSTDHDIVKAYLDGTGTLTDKQYKIADCNGDGNIDSADLLKIQRYVLGYDEPELFTKENQ